MAYASLTVNGVVNGPSKVSKGRDLRSRIKNIQSSKRSGAMAVAGKENKPKATTAHKTTSGVVNNSHKAKKTGGFLKK